MADILLMLSVFTVTVNPFLPVATKEAQTIQVIDLAESLFHKTSVREIINRT